MNGYDVIVVGGGNVALCAALSAAREGAMVIFSSVPPGLSAVAIADTPRV